MEERLENRLPLIGDKAPSFKAATTQGEINFPEDYKKNGLFYFRIHLTLRLFVQQSLLLLAR
jgi:hypothetical protein